MTVADRLSAGLDCPIKFLLWATMALGFAMMMHVTVDVACRTLLNQPLTGTTEVVSAYYMVATCYLPWAHVARTDGHIVAGMFQRLGGPMVDFVLDVVVKLATIVYTALFTYETYLRADQQTRAGEVWQVGSGFIPVWPSRWMLPVAGGLMVLHFVLRVVRDMANGPAKEPAPAG
jgi:TRAP-type C4-dicarboxylate transport system permease small subunit